MSITKTPTSMIDPNGATAGQVLTFNASTSAWGASSLSANGFSVSLSSNGYQKFPSGLIIQWGTVADDGATKTFTIPFTTACFSLIGTCLNDSFDAGGSINAFVVSLSEFRLRNGGVASPSIPNYWQAIGY